MSVASVFGAQAMQAVVSGQAVVAIGVVIGAIQLLGALASVKHSAVGATVMKKRGAETRSAFPFFALSTYLPSARAYAAWLMKPPEYREIRDDHGTRRDGLHTDVSELYR